MAETSPSQRLSSCAAYYATVAHAESTHLRRFLRLSRAGQERRIGVAHVVKGLGEVFPVGPAVLRELAVSWPGPLAEPPGSCEWVRITHRLPGYRAWGGAETASGGYLGHEVCVLAFTPYRPGIQRVLRKPGVCAETPGRMLGTDWRGGYGVAMVQKKGGTAVTQDVRFDVPLFTIDEGARHLAIPASTLRDWTHRMAGLLPSCTASGPQRPGRHRFRSSG